MRNIFLGFLIILSINSTAFASSFSCEAELRSISKEGEVLFQKRRLILVSLQSIDQVIRKYAVKLGNFSFSVIEDTTFKSLLVIITKGPQFNKGVATRGDFDQEGIFRVTMLDNGDTQSIICEKK